MTSGTPAIVRESQSGLQGIPFCATRAGSASGQQDTAASHRAGEQSLGQRSGLLSGAGPPAGEHSPRGPRVAQRAAHSCEKPLGLHQAPYQSDGLARLRETASRLATAVKSDTESMSELLAARCATRWTHGAGSDPEIFPSSNSLPHPVDFGTSRLMLLQKGEHDRPDKSTYCREGESSCVTYC